MTTTLRTVPSITRQVGLRVLTGDRLTMLMRMGECLHDNGAIGRHQFGTRTVIAVNTPEAAGEVLLTREEDYHKGPVLAIYSRPLLGNGLLTSEGDFHRRQRRLAAPAFAHKRVAAYAPFMAEATQKRVDCWQDGETIDAAREMMRLTLAIVGKTLFDNESVEDEADDLGKALTVSMRFFINALRSPIRLPFAWIPPWATDVKASLSRLDETIYRMVDERRRAGGDTGDLVSMLLLARENDESMDNRQIRDEVMTFFLAGHETTANALAWTLYLLAAHPDICARVESETDGCLQGRLPTYEGLAAMPYSLQVIKEAMRLYPPAYALVRQAQRSTEISGYFIPAKAIVLISPYLLHRRPEVFPNPEQFDPDRFTPENEQTRPRYAYLPFGGGPRICIGAAFALMEAQIILLTLVQRVRLRLASDAPILPEPLITLRPRGGIPMIVTRR